MGDSISREDAKAQRAEAEILAVAKAIYRFKPFKNAFSRSVFANGMVPHVFDWEDAPAYYKAECEDLAGVALDGLRAFAASRET